MGQEFSIKSRLKSFKYAFAGIWHVLRNEHNFVVQLLVAVIVVLAGFYLSLSTNEWLWIIASIALVLTTEIFNTAIEKLVDLTHPEHGKKAGLIKDISAGAVLIASISAAIIGLLIFVPKII